LKLMIIDIIAFSVILGVSLALVFFVFGVQGIGGLQTSMIILNHVYGMLVLTWLLGYGMFQFPLHVFSKSFQNYMFYKEVAKSASVYEDFRECQIELYRHANACTNAIKLIKENGYGYDMRVQVEMLEQSIPENYDDGIRIGKDSHIREFEINQNMTVNNSSLGKCRFKLMTAYYQYKRKQSRWISIVNRITSKMKPIEECKRILELNLKIPGFDAIKIEIKKQKKKSKYGKNDSIIEQEELVEFQPRLFPEKQNVFERWFFRFLAIFVAIYILIILSAECFLLFKPEYTLVYQSIRNVNVFFIAFSFTILFLVSMVLLSLFSLFTINFADF